MTTVDVSYLSITEAGEGFRRREFSPVDLTRALLERIERLNPALDAFVTVTADRALAEAREAEGRLLRGDDAEPLLGVPIAHKDIIATAGVRTTAGSALLTDWTPERDATVVARLREAGAVSLGKLITHEFALGMQRPGEHLPPARNPWDTDRIPSGSSSGSGAALAAGLCLGATGSDTGGSIRGPAAFCGITGLKPTYGRVSRAGVVSLAWSLDHVGPMARSAQDCAFLLQAMAGHDPADPASASAPVDDYLSRVEEGVGGLRIGVPRRFFFEELQPEVERAVEEAIEAYRAMGAEVRDVDIPSVEATAINPLIMFVEAFAYHQDDLHNRPHLFGKGAGNPILAGGLFTGGEYVQAQRLRRRLRDEVAAVFREVDLLLTAASPEPAPTFEESYAAPRPRRSRTALFNLTGCPALVQPCAFSSDLGALTRPQPASPSLRPTGAAPPVPPSGLPLAFQLAGPPFAEALVLRAAHAYQRETDWHRRRPPI